MVLALQTDERVPNEPPAAGDSGTAGAVNAALDFIAGQLPFPFNVIARRMPFLFRHW
jgi:hypothetical protein